EIIPDSITTVVQEPGDTPFQPADRDDTLSPLGTITVSGTVTGPGGPVPDVSVGGGSPQDYQSTTTNPSGFYSVPIETDGSLWFNVRPPGLTQINFWTDGVTASFTQDFVVTNGYTLSVRFTGSDGTPLTGDFWPDVQPLAKRLPDGWWYQLEWDEANQRHTAVLPPDVYYVTAHDPPPGYYETSQPFDLRTADQVVDLSLNTTYVHPIPYDPPDSTRITIGSVDGLGEATVIGAPGAVLPLAQVLLVNLNSTHQAHAISEADGTLYTGAMTWGGIVMTPGNEAQLIAHGRRGVDFLTNIPNHWFISCRDLPIPPGAIGHTLNAYFNGDIVWSGMEDSPGECPAGVSSGGDSLVMGASVQDTVGMIEAAVRTRADRVHPPLAAPGTLSERFNVGEIPLFISTRSGRPAQLVLRKIEGMVPDDVDQIAYSYRSSQRPGVRVRELVAEDGQSGGYWRLDTLYDDQLSVGVQGDQPNDFKFQYVGVVYRDLDSGHNEYAGQGSGWIFIPDDDPTGSRVMPPFAGPGNGGWTTEGGPILTLNGEDIHIFILPTGVRPGAVLQTGDMFRFAGHIMPTLDSRVAVTVTAPSGTQYLGGGQANHVGYFYNPDDAIVVDEPGLWSVDVRSWHDGQCSGGVTIPPYPSGDVLGSEDGRYWFYVVPGNASRLQVSSPSPGFLSFEGEVTPITITGSVPAGLSGVTVDYTISMPGYILKHGQVTPSGDTYQI
ncbi:MAG: carboxypeptidase-like regulatory domain-containing protein, partial [Anaerolineae bacterium]